MKNLYAWLTGDLFKAVGSVVDELITSDEERIIARNKILALLLEKSYEIDKIKADIIQSETKGNWLQRSWRPILMLSFGFIVMYAHFIAPAFGLPNTELTQDFWQLLKLGIGGYVVGRSVEKVADKIAPSLIKNKK